MRKLIFLLITMTIIPSIAMAWQGKIVAVESATIFVILKDGQTPVKIELAGVKPSEDIDQAKAKLGSSNIVLMKDVEVRELGKSENQTILGDITIDGKSLAKELLDEDIVQSTAVMDDTKSQVAVENNIPKVIASPTEPVAAPKSSITSQEMLSELSPANEELQPVVESVPQPQPIVKAQKPEISYVQAQQAPQPLGLWPARPVVQQIPSMEIKTRQNTSNLNSPQLGMPNAKESNTHMQQPGDIAKKDYELAVKVQKNTRRSKNRGFLIPKKKADTFVGGSIGTQLASKSSSTAPYSTFGAMGGASIRHFYPSGVGVGGDITMGRTSGKSGSFGGSNSTNGTAYDYKNKNFDTYTFTASLLYRFYTDPRWTPYVALHGGYSFFSYPNTSFNISDGAPVAGGGGGILYEFDSGFTLGADMRYLKTLGTRADDPAGFLNTTINFGYTFD